MTSYQAGDELEINGTTVIITKQGFRSTRYSWYCPAAGEGGEVAFPTPEEAVDHAYRTLGRECRHGALGFCPTCHDSEG